MGWPFTIASEKSSIQARLGQMTSIMLRTWNMSDHPDDDDNHKVVDHQVDEAPTIRRSLQTKDRRQVPTEELETPIQG